MTLVTIALDNGLASSWCQDVNKINDLILVECQKFYFYEI